VFWTRLHFAQKDTNEAATLNKQINKQNMPSVLTIRNFDSHLTSQPHIVSVSMQRDSGLGLLPIKTGNPSREGNGFQNTGSNGAQMIGKVFNAMTVVKQHQSLPTTFVVH